MNPSANDLKQSIEFLKGVIYKLKRLERQHKEQLKEVRLELKKKHMKLQQYQAELRKMQPGGGCE